MENLYSYTKDVAFNGKTLAVKISADVEPDDIDPAGDFDCGDAEENAAYLARFHSGELQMMVIRVTARFMGLEGTDYLGACHVSGEEDCRETIEEYGMEDTAIQELMDELDAMHAALTKERA